MNPHRKIDRPEVTALLFSRENCVQSPCPAGAEDVLFETEPGIALQCRFYFAAQDAPVLFVYPATAGDGHSFDGVAQDYCRQGMNIFLTSYRGCGKNSGSPSVSAMYADSEKLLHLAFDWLAGRGCLGPYFIMGQSVGSTCAIDTVVKNGDSIKGLIVESGICDTSSFLGALGESTAQADITEEEGFNTLEKIEKIKTPTLIFHGARDGLVAIAEAEKLQASSGARTKQFFVIPGAEHHTVGKTGGELYIKTIKQFIDTVSGVNTWRQKRRDHKSKRKNQVS
ncbi:alpha/beta hydrolase family protein [Desulfocastanea catecholica]